MRAVHPRVLTFHYLCLDVYVGHGRVSLAKTAEPMEMPSGGADLRRSKKLCVLYGCTLALPGEYDGSICSAAAMPAVANIAMAACLFLCCLCIYNLLLFTILLQVSTFVSYVLINTFSYLIS